MKVGLFTLNSKYIHTNLAIRYLKAYAQDSYDIDIKEYTIKDDIDDIASDILSNNYSIIGFSCYIWNIKQTSKLIRKIKNLNIDIKIMIGGPEVSYDINHWFKTLPIDFIISGEGEYAFKLLLDSISKDKDFSSIPGLSYKQDNIIVSNINDYIIDLKTIPTPYQFPEDINKLSTRITYIEFSRGCPYKCSYCMSSLENNVRYFDINYIKEQILFLMNNGARTFKFLDRTFNTNKHYAKDIFDFIIEHHLPNTQFQFEITGDIFPIELIHHLNQKAPKGLFRFEIGIQSTNQNTNRLVNRFQNYEKLANNILLIQEGNKIDLHLDLIAGLPEEDYNSFTKTFNDVFALRPKELQLGFLKMLRGTSIRKDATKWGYKYHEEAPYEIINNSVLNEEDIKFIHIAEDMLEKYWNSSKFQKSLPFIIDNYYKHSPYLFFEEFGLWWTSANFSNIKYQLDDLFKRITDFLTNKKIMNDEIMSILKIDYLLLSKIKPKIWWEKPFDKKIRNELLRRIYNSNITNHTLDQLYKYSVIENVIIDNDYQYFLILYMPNKQYSYLIKEDQI